MNDRPAVPPALVEIAAGAALFAAAVATTMILPHWMNLVITIQSVGANKVVLPLAYWAVAAVLAVLVARPVPGPLVPVLARTAIVAFVSHILVLLAASAPWVLARATYGTAIYWAYARAFYAATVVAASAWVASGAPLARRSPDPLALAAIVPSLIVLALSMTRQDPAAGVAAIVLGLAVAWSAGNRLAPVSAALAHLASNRRLFFWAIFTAALALRLLYTMRVMTDPDYLDTGGDARFYDRLAWSMAQGEGIPPHGYPLLILGYVRFLALVYWIFGHSYFIACAVQSVIGAAVAVGIGLLGARLYGELAGRLAAVFTATSFLLAFAAASLGHQAIDVGLTLAVIALLAASAADAGRWWKWFVAGTLLGAAIAVRETTAFVVPFVYLWIAWVMPPPSRWRLTVRAAAVLSAGAAIVLVPLVAPMVSTPDRRADLRAHFDRLFTSNETPGREGLAGPLTDPDAALRQLRTEPGFVLQAEVNTVRHNVAVQFFTQPFGEFDVVSLRKESDYYYGLWCYAYVLTIAGAVVAIGQVRRRAPGAAVSALVVGVIVCRTIPHLFLESGYRHRAPLEPLLILLCAAGVSAVVGAARASTPSHPGSMVPA